MDDDALGNDPFITTSGSRGGATVFLPIGIALIGLVLGGVALYFSLSKGKQDELSQQLTAKSDQITQLEKRNTELNAQVEKLSLDMTDLKQQLRTITGQTQNALNKVGQEIIATRQQIATNSQKIKEIVDGLNSGTTRRPTATASSGSTSNASGSTSTSSRPSISEPSSEASSGGFVPGGMRSHVIAEGETFSSVATRYGVPLQKVIEANPDVNPNRLQIGQKINVPQQ